jgi:tetratricopeptide (TPR) repeat protein
LELFIYQLSVTAARAKKVANRFRQVRRAQVHVWAGVFVCALVTGTYLAQSKIDFLGEHWQVSATVAGCLYGAVVGIVLGWLIGGVICWFESITYTEFPNKAANILVALGRRIGITLRLLVAIIVFLPWLVVAPFLGIVFLLIGFLRAKLTSTASQPKSPVIPLTEQLGWIIAWLFPLETWGYCVAINAVLLTSGFSAAIEECLRRIDKEPANSILYALVGVLYMNSGNIGLAFSAFSKAIELNPNDSDSFWNRGTVHWLRSDILKARRDYDESLRLSTGGQRLSDILLMRGLTFLAEPQGADNALQDISQAIELADSDRNSSYLFWQYVARQRLGVDLFEEQSQIVAAIEAEKNTVQRLRVTAKLAAINGDLIQAKEVYQQVMSESNTFLLRMEQASLDCLVHVFPDRSDIRSLANWFRNRRLH